MSKKGGFPGGMGGMNMTNLMKQAQRMQRQLQEEQESFAEREFSAAAGGGVVEVRINGKREITSISLKEEIVDPEDIEMLEDLIVAAVNEALKAVEDAQAESMAKYTGGMGGLGGFGF